MQNFGKIYPSTLNNGTGIHKKKLKFITSKFYSHKAFPKSRSSAGVVNLKWDIEDITVTLGYWKPASSVWVKDTKQLTQSLQLKLLQAIRYHFHLSFSGGYILWFIWNIGSNSGYWLSPLYDEQR